MLAVTVKLDERSIKEAEHILRAIPGGADRAMYTALNKVAGTSKTMLARLVARRLGSNVGLVKSRIGIKRANRFTMRAALDVSTHRTILISLGAQQTPLGVTYQPFGKGKTRLLRHAFIARGPSRGTQVWLRSEHVLGRKKYIEWQGRHMEALYLQKGSSLSSLLEPQDVQAVVKKGADDLPRVINSQIAHVLDKWKK